MVNRLAEESSPYLQQHKNNPVNWFPWNDEALEIAEKGNKPLFISIGYSTCHWCHVMARESFEDKKTADYMNKNFVNIKIDREEYPGVDKAYQEMFQMIHQRGGGWPLSVWAEPNGTPFYIGTYFPDEPKHGMPSFLQVNHKLMELWKNERDTLTQQGNRLSHALKSIGTNWKGTGKELDDDRIYKEIISLQRRFDGKHGGIGNAPKFPRVSSLRFLLREGKKKDLKEIIEFVSFTFHKMSRGGIYDQLGGGFARYSVDRQWLVPHFEKMLYDNGALVLLGAELSKLTDDRFVDFIVRDTIAWIAREMQHENGGFYSALNAESEGREGTFYVWHENDLKELLKEDFEVAKLRFGITKEGNFEDPHHQEIDGMNVLSIRKSIQNISKEIELSEDEVVEKLERIRQILYSEREKREKPSTDTKIITSWNCIAIRGLLAAGQLLQFPEAIDVAIKGLNRIIEENIHDEYVSRIVLEDADSQEGKIIEGILDDYSFLIATLIDAYEFTDKFEYLKLAEKLFNLTQNKFFKEDEMVYSLNPSTEKSLFKDIVQATDDSMESGIGVMVYNLFKLGKYLEKPEYISIGDEMINRITTKFSDYPGAISTLLNSANPYLNYPAEIVMINPTEEMNKAVLSTYFSDRLIYRFYDKDTQSKPDWEVMEGRKNVDKPTIYICRGQTCSLPILSVEDWYKEVSETSN